MLGAMMFVCLYILYKRKENKVDNNLYLQKDFFGWYLGLALAILLFWILFADEYICAVDSSPFAAGFYQELTIGIRVVIGFKGIPLLLASDCNIVCLCFQPCLISFNFELIWIVYIWQTIILMDDKQKF